jgi:hypothetical protein
VKTIRLLAVLVSSFVLLIASGGGGGDGGVVDPTLTGQFVDDPVGGLRYSTATKSGTTDATGTFEYLDGEVVSFFLGDLMLGQVQAKSSISPFDLVPGADPVTGADVRKELRPITNGPSSDAVPPYHVVVNIAMLLQTLDKDGDPSNGLEIPAAAAAMFSAGSLDLNDWVDHFRRDFRLRSIMAQINDQGLLDDWRQVARPWRVMGQLYTTLGIQNPVQAQTGWQQDSNLDGMPEIVTSFEFDAEGRRVRVTKDEPAGGPLESDSTSQYDANDNRIRQDSSSGQITIWEYDANGNQTAFKRDDGDGGTPEYEDLSKFDANSNRIGSSTDEDGDGSIDRSATFEFDADGNEIRREDFTPGNPMPVRIFTYDYNADGQLTMIRFDDGADGTIDSSTVNTYDENGRQTSSLISNNVADTLYTFRYDAIGNRTRIDTDDFNDGDIDSSDTWEYDSHNRVTRYVRDFDGDSTTPNPVDTYEYDVDGNVTRRENDDIGDGMPNRIRIWQYDANGFLVGESEDSDGDGMPNWINTYTNDANGNQLLSQNDNDANGTTDSETTRQYNNFGWWEIFLEVL